MSSTPNHPNQSEPPTAPSAPHEVAVLRRCGGCGCVVSVGEHAKLRPDVPRGRACMRCKVAYFCNKTCQRRGWPTHKKVCINTGEIDPRIMLEHKQRIVQQVVPEVFGKYVAIERESDGPCCLVITDFNNAAEHTQVWLAHEVRKAMRDSVWDSLPQGHRDKFEQHCIDHVRGNDVHLVFLDTRIGYFNTARVVFTAPPPTPDT